MKQEYIGRIIEVNNNSITIDCIGKLPPIGAQLQTINHKNEIITTKVHSYLDNNTIIAITMETTLGLARKSVVTKVADGFFCPVGDHVLGRMINGYGQFIDDQDDCDLEDCDREEVSKFIPSMPSIQTTGSIIETGIKIIDFYAPVKSGGAVGIAGGAGVGKTQLTIELMENLYKKFQCKSIFVGIGERSREGKELYDRFLENEMINIEGESKVAMVMAQMCTTPGERIQAIESGLTIARNTSKESNVLLIVDNLFRLLQAESELSADLNIAISEGGYPANIEHTIGKIQSMSSSLMGHNGTITKLYSIFLAKDDIYDAAAMASYSITDSLLVLSREMASKKYYPAIDILASKSNILTLEHCAEKHIRLVEWAKGIMQYCRKMQAISEIYGKDNLSEPVKNKMHKGDLLRAYFTQPLFSTESITSIKGKWCSLADTIRGVEMIKNGDLDYMTPKQLYMIGSIDEIIAKKEKPLQASNKGKA